MQKIISFNCPKCNNNQELHNLVKMNLVIKNNVALFVNISLQTIFICKSRKENTFLAQHTENQTVII